MRLSWCGERAISPYRPQRTQQALRQTWRGRRQSSHWLHRFKRQSRWNERCQDSSAKLVQSVEFWAVCEPIVGLFGRSDFVVRKQPWDYVVCFPPKPWGNFLRIWAWLIRREVLLQHFTGVRFHLVEWITAGYIWDYYYLLCKWTNQLLKTVYLFRIHMKCLFMS